jgi:hypothetical protein
MGPASLKKKKEGILKSGTTSAPSSRKENVPLYQLSPPAGQRNLQIDCGRDGLQGRAGAKRVLAFRRAAPKFLMREVTKITSNPQ